MYISMCVVLVTYHPRGTFQTVNNGKRFAPFKRGVKEHYVFMHCSLLCARRENNIIIVDNLPCVIYAVVKRVIKNNICINKCPGAAALTGRDFCYAPNTSLTARYTAEKSHTVVDRSTWDWFCTDGGLRH